MAWLPRAGHGRKIHQHTCIHTHIQAYTYIYIHIHIYIEGGVYICTYCWDSLVAQPEADVQHGLQRSKDIGEDLSLNPDV